MIQKRLTKKLFSILILNTFLVLNNINSHLYAATYNNNNVENDQKTSSVGVQPFAYFGEIKKEEKEEKYIISEKINSDKAANIVRKKSDGMFTIQNQTSKHFTLKNAFKDKFIPNFFATNPRRRLAYILQR